MEIILGKPDSSGICMQGPCLYLSDSTNGAKPGIIETDSPVLRCELSPGLLLFRKWCGKAGFFGAEPVRFVAEL